jgi:hypothetical protein
MAVERQAPAHSYRWSAAVDLGGELAGRCGRTLSLAGAVTLGVVLAIVAIPQFAPWLSAHHFHH